MNIIVAGGRDFDDYQLLSEKLDKMFQNITPTIICGEANGADLLGRRYAREHNLMIRSFPANWKELGKRAGFVRNEVMAEVADGLVAFWDGKSKGTKHMIETMQKMNKPVRIIKYEVKTKSQTYREPPNDYYNYYNETLNG